MRDNYTTPEGKARWGFGGSKRRITVSPAPAGKGEAQDEPKARAKGRRSGGQRDAETK